MNQREELQFYKKIDCIVPFIDVAVVKADTDISHLDKKRLINHDALGAKPKYDCKKNGKQYTYKNGVRIFQPSHNQFDYIYKSTTEDRINIYLNRAEVAFDFISFSVTPSNIGSRVKQSLVHHRNGGNYFQQYQNTETDYWGNRDLGHKFYPVAYSDRPSKITGDPCYHLEYRILDKEKCAEHNLGVLSDLKFFSYTEFFRANTLFYVYPTNYIIGVALANDQNKEFKTIRGYEKFAKNYIAINEFSSSKPPIQELLSKIRWLKQVMHSRENKPEHIEYTRKVHEILIPKITRDTI